MKMLKQTLNLSLILILTSFVMTSCEEGMTIDVPGPDVEFVFDYSEFRSAESNYVLVAQSDTVFGKDVESFLAESDQDFASVVESATMKDAYLTLSEGRTFGGVDSIQIRYRVVGTDMEFVLTEAGSDSNTLDTLWFNEVKVDKTQIFEFISSDIISSIYAIFNPATPDFNCFMPGVTYTFRAKTSLAVQLAALAQGFAI